MRHPAWLGILALLITALACQAPASGSSGASPQPPNAGGSSTGERPPQPPNNGGSPSAATTGSPPELGGAARRELGGGGAAPAPVAVRYAYSATSIVFLAQKVAQEQGIYRQHG